MLLLKNELLIFWDKVLKRMKKTPFDVQFFISSKPSPPPFPQWVQSLKLYTPVKLFSSRFIFVDQGCEIRPYAVQGLFPGFSQVLSRCSKWRWESVIVKGTVSSILSDASCKDGNARFTTVPLQPVYDR